MEKPGRDDRLDSDVCKHTGPALRSDLVGACALELGAGTVSRFELAVPAATTIQRGIRKHLGKATTAAVPDSATSLADVVSQLGKAVSDGKYRA